MSKYLIGIDPDIEKCGYGVYNRDTQNMVSWGRLDFWSILDTINQYKNECKVIIEGGWLIRKKNWRPSGNPNIGERIAYNVGQNHCVGKLIEQYCAKNGIEYEVVRPRGKIDRRSFQKITGINQRVNQDVIDAVMLVFGY